ncbi:MAG: hypothetical protein IID48_17465 [Proteobacteria bacterium]|nr:hypothetical protein [Pseudomonadota bacterium]
MIYILYLLNLIFGVTSFIGVIMAYVNKADAPEWVQSHYRFQIRTFWIALMLGAIGAVTAAFVVGILILAFLFIWWIARCVTGMRYFSEGRAHPDPASWMFG